MDTSKWQFYVHLSMKRLVLDLITKFFLQKYSFFFEIVEKVHIFVYSQTTKKSNMNIFTFYIVIPTPALKTFLIEYVKYEKNMYDIIVINGPLCKGIVQENIIKFMNKTHFVFCIWMDVNVISRNMKY